ncbi:MAG: AbgT family transporter, partial [Bacilli bacterium]|nr:AbgT family transporter [Bacilli bacterium]
MRKIRKVRDKIKLHPIMSFIVLIVSTIILSGVLNFFNVSSEYNRITSAGNYEQVFIAVESLFNLSGLKYIFSNTVSNFASFMPLSMLLITLIGVGIMDKSGFLDSFFYVFTKRSSKRIVTFSLSLICIISTIIGDLSFIALIPLSALLFKYGKRNPKAGIIVAFASITCGIG